jgi:hypothetical protein
MINQDYLSNSLINLDYLTAGIYFISLKTQKKLLTSKIVKLSPN